MVILGDINIDLNHPETINNDYFDFINSFGFLSCNCLPTREDLVKNTATNIDHILVRLKNFTVWSGTIMTKISDHHSLFFAIKHDTKLRVVENRQEKKILIDNNKVKQIIEETNFQDLMQINSSKELYNSLVKKMTIIYKNAEYESDKLRRRRPYPWIDYQLLKHCKERDRLYNIWKRNRYDKVKEINYKSYRNMVTKKFNKAKCDYFKSKFLETKDDTRKTWETINEVLGRKTNNADQQIRNNFALETETLANNFANNY